MGFDAQENVASYEDQCSEEIEDVRVCDICGDVGEEKKLSVCSRCNDGAEHIYCMRVMLQEVPDGEWLCEECQTKVETEREKKKQEKFQVQPAEISSENDVETEQVGNKELSKASHGNDMSSRNEDEAARIIERCELGTCNVCSAPCSSCSHHKNHSFHMESEVGSAPSGCTSTFIVKEDDSGSCIGGSEAVNKNKACHDCEETSNVRSNVFNLKSVDGDRHGSGWRNNDVSCISEVKDASNVAIRNKYLSTQSEVKSSEEIEDVKVCDICGDVGEEKKLAICSRCNDGAEHIYCMRVMIEEVPEVEWLCEACQTEVEIKKKQEKVDTKKRLFLKGQISKPVNASKSSSSDNDMLDENISSKDSNRRNRGYCMTTKSVEEDAVINAPVPQNFPERGGLSIEVDSRKRVSLSLEIPFKSDAQKGKESIGQIPTTSVSNALKNHAPPLHGKLTKSISFNNSKVPKVKQLVDEFPLKPENSKESFRSNMKQEWTMNTLAKSTSFKKSNSTEPANKSRPSIFPHAEEPRVMNSLMSRNVAIYRGTSTSGCSSVTAPTVAPVPLKAESTTQHFTKGNNMIEPHNLTIAHGQSRSSLGHRELKEPLQAKGHVGITLTSAERTSGAPGPSHQDEKILNPPNLRPGGSVGCSSAVSSDLEGKTLLFSSQGCSPSDDQIASIFPELNYIWKGGFELWRTGRSPELCEGLQAHLSCSASPQAVEVAKKFPSQIQLEELPCQNLWIPQFQEKGPAYDSIGLFFFAQDTESYENHYSKLVENMLKDDLALRGNVGTTEVLIFTSNMLPKNFQRWNMFYYLWGAFRVRREDRSNLPPDELISNCSNLNEDLQDVDLRTTVFSSGGSCSKEQNNDVNKLSQPFNGRPLEDQRHDSIIASFSTNDNSTINGFTKVQKLAYPEHQDKIWDSSNGNGGEVSFNVNTEPDTCSVSSIHEGRESTTINIDSSEHHMNVDPVNATEVRPCNISHISSGARKRSVEMANWADEVNGKGRKKLKLDNEGSVKSG